MKFETLAHDTASPNQEVTHSPSESYAAVVAEAQRLLDVLSEAVEAYPEVFVHGEKVPFSLTEFPDLIPLAEVQRLKEGLEQLLSTAQEDRNDPHREQALGALVSYVRGVEQALMSRADAMTRAARSNEAMQIVAIMDSVGAKLANDNSSGSFNERQAA